MNKKLLAVAVSAALVAPAAAMAGEVTVYGHAQVEVASYSEDSPGSGKDGVAVEDNARGRVGVKASEDLGNGLKSFAQFEFKADTTDNDTDKSSAAPGGTDGNASLTGRVSQVGLKGGFGSVMLGNLKSPYKYTGGVKYDPFVTTSLQARGNGGMTSGSKGHNGFVKNMVGYASPKGPVTVGVIYGPTENEGNFAADVKYSAGGVEAFVAAYDDGDISDYTATKVGGQFKSGPHKISGQYEMIDTGTNEPTVLFLGYQMKMGKNTFALQYADADPDVNGVDNTTYVALGVIHKFSKMTRLFAGYRDTSDIESVVTVGLRKDFK